MQHRPQLDGLRALAVLAVIITHTWPMPQCISSWGIGGLGVSLFFVLSGYLITRILLHSRLDGAPEISRQRVLKRFYARRALRILPLYIVTVAVLYVIGHEDVREYIAEYATATVNMIPMLGDRGLRAVGARHFWSLSVEEQFYLVWPVLVLFTPRRRLAMLMICTVLLGVSFRLTTIAGSVYFPGWQQLTPTHCDELGLGACTAFFGAPSGIWGAVGLLTLVSAHGTAAETFLGPIAWAVLCAWIVGRAVHPRGLWEPLASRPLIYIGTISYGVYVLHWPIVWALQHIGIAIAPGVTLFAVVSVLTVAAASLSWIAIEGPLNRLKRFVPST